MENIFSILIGFFRLKKYGEKNKKFGQLTTTFLHQILLIFF